MLTEIDSVYSIILGQIVNKLGGRYSRLSPKWCKWSRCTNIPSSYYIYLDTIVFCSFDIVSLVVQALGGGIASAATTRSGTELVSPFGPLISG